MRQTIVKVVLVVAVLGLMTHPVLSQRGRGRGRGRTKTRVSRIGCREDEDEDNCCSSTMPHVCSTNRHQPLLDYRAADHRKISRPGERSILQKQQCRYTIEPSHNINTLYRHLNCSSGFNCTKTIQTRHGELSKQKKACLTRCVCEHLSLKCVHV